jgi:hypothetical protein
MALGTRMGDGTVIADYRIAAQEIPKLMAVKKTDQVLASCFLIRRRAKGQ